MSCVGVVILAGVASLAFVTTLILFRWRYQRTRAFYVVFLITTVVWFAIGFVTGVIPILWGLAFYASIWLLDAL